MDNWWTEHPPKKWWEAPEGTELEEGNRKRHGKLGGVSPNELVDGHSVKAAIVSGYTDETVFRYDIHPFKLPLGITIDVIKDKVLIRRATKEPKTIIDLCFFDCGPEDKSHRVKVKPKKERKEK